MSPGAASVVRGTGGAVACGHPLAAGAAVSALRSGGSAVDAAIAAAAVLAVVLPHACGLGGDALMLVRSGGETVAFNGSGAAPRGLRGAVPGDGPGTVAVPGAVAAWADAHRASGRLELRELLATAVRLARDGFPVGAPLLAALDAQRARLMGGARSWALLAPGLVPGSVVRQPALARTLERLGGEGLDTFYAGWPADAIARATRGHLERDDLDSHRTVVRPPVQGRYRGASILVGPPVSQAILALLALHGLDGREGDAAARAHAAIELIEAAFALRDLILSDDAERRLMSEPLDFDPERALHRGGPRGYNHTTAITTADADGTVVAMLASLFDDFGSAVLVEEAGFVLNDRLLGFSSDPASPNAPAPGRRPVHTLSPLMLEREDQVLAMATPGADGQVQVLVQLVDRLVHDGAPLGEALGEARWRSIDGMLAVEAGFDPALAAELARRGHRLQPRPPGDESFGAACVAGVDSVNGSLFAAADGRREGWAAVW